MTREMMTPPTKRSGRRRRTMMRRRRTPPTRRRSMTTRTMTRERTSAKRKRHATKRPQRMSGGMRRIARGTKRSARRRRQRYCCCRMCIEALRSLCPHWSSAGKSRRCPEHTVNTHTGHHSREGEVNPRIQSGKLTDSSVVKCCSGRCPSTRGVMSWCSGVVHCGVVVQWPCRVFVCA